MPQVNEFSWAYLSINSFIMLAFSLILSASGLKFKSPNRSIKGINGFGLYLLV